jgi:hypothetical protein
VQRKQATLVAERRKDIAEEIGSNVQFGGTGLRLNEDLIPMMGVIAGNPRNSQQELVGTDLAVGGADACLGDTGRDWTEGHLDDGEVVILGGG